MSMFFVLPVRASVADHLASCLNELLPGLDLTVAIRRQVADLVLDGQIFGNDVFLITRDELPHGAALEQALIDGYGATPGDEITEVRMGARPGEFRTTRWVILGEPAELLAG